MPPSGIASGISSGSSYFEPTINLCTCASFGRRFKRAVQLPSGRLGRPVRVALSRAASSPRRLRRACAGRRQCRDRALDLDYPSQRTQALRARTSLIARAAGAEANLIPHRCRHRQPPRGRQDLPQADARSPENGRRDRRRCSGVSMRSTARSCANLMQRCWSERSRTSAGALQGFREPLATEFRNAADQWLLIAQRQLVGGPERHRQGADTAAVPRR